MTHPCMLHSCMWIKYTSPCEHTWTYSTYFKPVMYAEEGEEVWISKNRYSGNGGLKKCFGVCTDLLQSSFPQWPGESLRLGWPEAWRPYAPSLYPPFPPTHWPLDSTVYHDKRQVQNILRLITRLHKYDQMILSATNKCVVPFNTFYHVWII